MVRWLCSLDLERLLILGEVGPRCARVSATAGAVEPMRSDDNRTNGPKRMVRTDLKKQYDTKTVQKL